MDVRPGYKQTEVGVIPEDWRVLRLEELIRVKSGYAFSSAYFVDRGPVLLTPGNFKLGGGLYFNERNTKHYSGVYVSAMVLNRGDLLVVMTDLTPDCNLLGKPAFVLHDELILHNQRIGRIVPIGNISLAFLYYFFLSQAHAARMKETATGSTVRHTSNRSIYSSNIGLPPTSAEQEAIAEALSDADVLIESLEQLLTKKRQLKQGAMQELLTGKKRLPGFSGDWKLTRLGTVLTFQVGFPFSSLFFNEEGIGSRLVKNRDLKSDDQVFHYSGKFDLGFLVQDGDVLVGMDGDFLPCLWAKGGALLNQRVGRIVPLSGLSRVFAYYYLAEPLKEIESATSSTTVKHLSHGDVEGIELPLPHIEEQTAIATILSDMDADISALEAKLTKARAIKQGMMQQLLTGRIRLV